MSDERFSISCEEVVAAQALTIKRHVKDQSSLNRLVLALRQQIMKLGHKPVGDDGGDGAKTEG
jgi:hypothetical protein